MSPTRARRGRGFAVAALSFAAACSKGTPTITPAPSNGAVILSLQEVDRDGGNHGITERNGIADINSALQVRVDSTALRQQVSRLVGPGNVSPEVISHLAVLQEMAVKGLELVRQYSETLERYTANKTPENLKTVQQAIRSLAVGADTLLRIADKDAALGARLESRLETFFAGPRQSVGAQYAMLLAFAGEEAASARSAIDADSKQAGVRIQVGTWLSTSQGVRPISDPSLNTTAASSPFVVDQWALALTEEQKKQLQALSAAAKAANTNGAAGLITMLTASTRGTLQAIADQSQACAQSLINAVQGLTSNAGATPSATARQIIDQLQAHIDTLKGQARDLVALADKYRTPAAVTDPAAFLAGTNVDLATVRTTVEHTVTRVKQIQATLVGAPAALLQGGDLANGAAALRGKLDSCVVTMKVQLEGLVGALGLNQAEQIRALAEDAWNEVLSFDVAQVPPSSTVQLINAGPRQVGDIVLVRVRAARADSTKPLVLDEQQVSLQRVLPHLELAVGLVFADPLDSTGVQHRFQAAPAYSMLYRRGSRRSLSRNSFWNVGVGLNVAALDFDKDDVPELGLGLTASTFTDLLQAGFGYNVFLDHAYWFFGVRVPVGIVSLAGSRTPVPTDASSTEQ
jgi:hypothetical protein